MFCKKSLESLTVSLSFVIMVVLTLAQRAPAQNNYKTLYAFTGFADGRGANSLIFDQAGNLYGTTDQGGSSQFCAGGGTGCGTVFELTPNSDGTWTERVLYSFCPLSQSCDDGALPTGGVIFDQLGNLYGTTFYGGTQGGYGTVFKLTPQSDGTWSETVLHNFSGGNDGGAPNESGLIFDQVGNLSGTTFTGGSCKSQGCGVVFKLTPQLDGTWEEEVLYSFKSLKDGGQPFGTTLVFDQAGDLYGTTLRGGFGVGVVFQLSPHANGSWKEKVLHRFKRKDGAYPQGVIFDKVGKLYGTTQQGGNPNTCTGDGGCGVVFQLTPNSGGAWTDKTLHEFVDRDGSEPIAGLTFDQVGNLYGTTFRGGNPYQCPPIGCGVVFKLVPNSKGRWSATVIRRFNDHPGAFPGAAMIFDTAGNLYGTTVGDSTSTFGSVFEITP
jgi:uncharacterized repeat protein (TIGR03803 family)